MPGHHTGSAAASRKPPTGSGVLAGLVAGIGVNVLVHAAPEVAPWPLHAGFYGLLANIGIVSIFSVFGGRPDAAAEEFLQVARGRGKTA